MAERTEALQKDMFAQTTEITAVDTMEFHIIYTGSLSEDTYKSMNFLFVSCLSPIVGFTGVVTNILSIAVFNHSSFKMQRSQLFYVKALCAFDLLYILLMLYHYFFLEILSPVNPSLMSKITAYSGKYIDKPMTMPIGGGSILLMVVISFERLLAVCFPLTVKTSKVYTHPHIAIILVIVISICISVFHFVQYDVFSYYDPERGVEMWALGRSDFVTNNHIFGFFSKYIFGTTLEILYHGISVILVFTFSIITIVWLQIASKRRDDLLEVSRPDSNNRSKLAERQVTNMLLGISFLFLICVLPNMIFSFFYFFHPDFKFLGKEHFLVLSMISFISLMKRINSSGNMFVYVAFSRNFRQTLMQLFTRGDKSTGQKSTVVSTVSDTKM